VSDEQHTHIPAIGEITPSSTGRRFAGVVLIVFGSLLLVVASLSYLVALLLGIMAAFSEQSNPSGTFISVIAILGISVLFHISGQLMIRSGDYMQGKLGAMGEREILLSSFYFIIRDLLFAAVSIFLILGLLGFATGHPVLIICAWGLAAGCSWVSYGLKKKQDILEDKK